MDAERLAKIRKAAENVGSELMVGSGKLFIELSIFELLDHIDQLQRERDAWRKMSGVIDKNKTHFKDALQKIIDDSGYTTCACVRTASEALKDTP